MASLADAFASIESSGNPYAWNTLPGGRRSRYRGLFQFGPEQERRYGITDWTDPAQQRSAFDRHIGDLRTDLSRRLGRAPADWELYFGHQQGPSGSAALLNATPGTSAWEAIRPFYGSDAMAHQAITGNIPRGHALYGRDSDEIGADEFARMWEARYGRAPGAPAPLGAPVTPPVATAGMPSALPTDGASPASSSWLQRVGSGLMGAIVPSAQAATPPAAPAAPLIDALPFPPPASAVPPPEAVQPPASTIGAPPPQAPATEQALPPQRLGPSDDITLGGAMPGTLPPQVRSFLSTLPLYPPTVPPFGAPTVTPNLPTTEQDTLGYGPSEIQPPGRDITREMVEGGLPAAQPPPVDADAIVRGAEAAAADRAAQPAQPGYFERLMSNPAFLAGLSILGTAPGGNWGPNAAQAASQAIRGGREAEEWRRLQARRATQDRIWREAFGTNGQPTAGHPLLAGMPPEMAATIYAMGAEEGLPAAQRWQMFRGQQAEQLRIQQLQEEARMRAYGLGAPQAPPSGGDGLEVLTGDRLRAGAGLPGIADTSGIVPPGGPAPSAAGGPPSGGPSGSEATVRIGNVSMPISFARARAAITPHAGERAALEEAIKAAERTSSPPEAIRTRALQADQSYRTIVGALGDYVRLVEQAGMSGASWPGATRDAIIRARTNLLLQLKEMYNLGVLNGPDLSLMESMIPDPTISVGNVVGQGSVADRARRASDQLRRELERVRANALGAAGMPVPSGPQGGVTTRLRYNPTTGQMEPVS